MASDDGSEPADLPRGEITGDGSNGDAMSGGKSRVGEAI
jgi:hypothetical protein